MPLIDGRAMADSIRLQIKNEIGKIGIRPVLDIILAGQREDSLRYVNMKKDAVEEVGGFCRIHHLKNPTREEVENLINERNEDLESHGLMIQLPLPEPLSEDLLGRIVLQKDVDGLNPANLGLALTGRQYFTACGALACLKVLERFGPGVVPSCLLVGDSRDLILPLACALIGKKFPVKVVPEIDFALNLAAYDLIVLENGTPEFFRRPELKDTCILIDAGFYWKDGRLCGNVPKEYYRDEGGPWLLPVPGGIGPLLIAGLLENLVRAVEWHEKR